MTAPKVCGTVDAPSHVECERVAKQGADVESIVERFVPQQVRHICRNHKAAQQNQGQVVSAGRAKKKAIRLGNECGGIMHKINGYGGNVGSSSAITVCDTYRWKGGPIGGNKQRVLACSVNLASANSWICTFVQ